MKNILPVILVIHLIPLSMAGGEGVDFKDTLSAIRAAGPEVEVDEETIMEAMAKATPEQLASLLGDDLVPLKVCAATELGRRGHPATCLFLRAGNHRVRAAAAWGILDERVVEEGLLPLAKALSWSPSDPHFAEAAIEANLRIGGPAAVSRLLSFAISAGAPEELRVSTLKILESFETLAPEHVDFIDGELKKYLSNLRQTLTGEFLQECIALCEKVKRPIEDTALEVIFKNQWMNKEAREVALHQLMKNGADWNALVRNAKEPDYWTAVFKNWYLDNPEATLKTARANLGLDFPFNQIIHSSSTPLAQQTLLFLASLETAGADALLEEIINEQSKLFKIETGIWLEIEEVLALRSEAFSEDTLSNFAKLTAAAKKGPNPEDAYPELLAGGNKDLGFLVSVSKEAGCIECHSHWKSPEEFQDQGTIMLPFLTKSPSENLRAIIAPSHDLRNGYGEMRVETKDGTIHKGTPISQEEAFLKILTEGETKLLQIERDNIVQITQTSPMPSVLGKLNKREIRDLVAYLSEG